MGHDGQFSVCLLNFELRGSRGHAQSIVVGSVCDHDDCGQSGQKRDMDSSPRSQVSRSSREKEGGKQSVMLQTSWLTEDNIFICLMMLSDSSFVMAGETSVGYYM
jgi:hypothetical protein